MTCQVRLAVTHHIIAVPFAAQQTGRLTAQQDLYVTCAVEAYTNKFAHLLTSAAEEDNDNIMQQSAKQTALPAVTHAHLAAAALSNDPAEVRLIEF